MARVVLFVALLLLQSDGAISQFAPGWNGKAKTPPMGWRSWNAFAAYINHSIIEKNIVALTSPGWNVPGKQELVSLASLGYVEFGIDEGWERCNKTTDVPGAMQHNDAGDPIVNTTRFPNLAVLVDAGHAAGLNMGWYLAGCACGERTELDRNYAGDIAALKRLGFDAAKFDNCGAMKNITKYAELMKKSGKNYTIENCHWGHCWDQGGDTDASGCPTVDWCPFNLYRTSGDVAKSSGSWLHNLQTTTKFRDLQSPLSRPGCWAYPDMLECGMVEEPRDSPDLLWNRAHFGAWAISSSPLVLGADLSNTTLLKQILPIIGNPEAIEINQAWHGHPGMLVAGHGYEGKYVVLETCSDNDETQRGWSYSRSSNTIKGPGGLCLDNRTNVIAGRAIPQPENGQFQLRPCDGSEFQKFILNTTAFHPPNGKTSPSSQSIGILQSNDVPVGNSSRNMPGSCSAGVGETGPCCVKPNGWWDWNLGPVSCDNGLDEQVTFVNGQVHMHADPAARTKRCWSLWQYPVGGFEVQYWAKPLGNGAAALYIVNTNASSAKNASIQLRDIWPNLFHNGAAKIHDVYYHTDNGTTTDRLMATIGPADSIFVKLLPISS